MKATTSEVLQLVPESVPTPARMPVLVMLAAAALIIGAFGMAFSVLVQNSGPNVEYALVGMAGFIGCSVLVASATITLSLAGTRVRSGIDAPASVSYAVLAGGIITMLMSAGYAMTYTRALGNAETMAHIVVSGGGGFIAGAVLVAGGLIGAGFRSRNT